MTTTPKRKRVRGKVHDGYNVESERAKDAKARHLARLAKARAERERLVEQLRANGRAAELVALYRAERAKRIEAGKVVTPSIEEWREGRGRVFTASGEMA